MVLKAMILQDEISGRLTVVYSIKNYKNYHVVYDAFVNEVTHEAFLTASLEEIEHAISNTNFIKRVVSPHYISYKTIKVGK